jgi:hypothetical protein
MPSSSLIFAFLALQVVLYPLIAAGSTSEVDPTGSFRTGTSAPTDCSASFSYEGEVLEIPAAGKISEMKMQDLYKLVLILCHHQSDCGDKFEKYLQKCKGITSLSAISFPNLSLGFESGTIVTNENALDSPIDNLVPAGLTLNVEFSNGEQTLQAYTGDTTLVATKRFCAFTQISPKACTQILNSFIDYIIYDGHYHPSLPFHSLNYRSQLNSHWVHIPFVGIAYKLADSWFPFIPVFNFKDRPVKYLEIGVLTGANALSVAHSYAAHAQSEIHLIDPWVEYQDYSEYKGFQVDSYELFLKNLVSNSDQLSKFHVHRGYSYDQLIHLQDNYFDIIYIDGNHQPEYALEDAILSFRKLVVGGYLVFDDYEEDSLMMTNVGIDAFVSVMQRSRKIEVVGQRENQLFIKRIV